MHSGNETDHASGARLVLMAEKWVCDHWKGISSSVTLPVAVLPIRLRSIAAIGVPSKVASKQVATMLDHFCCTLHLRGCCCQKHVLEMLFLA